MSSGIAAVEVRGIEVFERDFTTRLPFRFGAMTLTRAAELHLRLTVLVDGAPSHGVSAEVLAPKWFDKSAALSPDETVEQLRVSLGLAARAYTGAGANTPFGLSADTYAAQQAAGQDAGMPPLAASFGLAALDKAVVDAVAKARGQGLPALLRDGALGLDARLTPDLDGFGLAGFLEGLRPLPSVEARHTVGLIDPLTAAELADGERPADGLPVTLEEVIAAYGHRWFKLKVGGDVSADIDRLAAIAGVLDRTASPYLVSIDGNEQYQDADGVLALLDGLDAAPHLDRFRRSIVYLEQPINREVSRSADLRAVAGRCPVIVDESDGTIDSFPHHAGLCYTGVSSKSCKGLYKALLNRARCANWNARDGDDRWFMTAEDLTAQAGLGVQQDLALVATLGITHVERNGHHYGRGMAAATAAEARAFHETFPDLYRDVGGGTYLAIRDGHVPTERLTTLPGLGGPVEPDVTAMRHVATYGDPG